MLMAFGCKTEAMVAKTKRADHVRKLVAQSEMEACTRAGLHEPLWQECGSGTMCFFCADEVGVMNRVIPPACSTSRIDEHWLLETEDACLAYEKKQAQ